MDPKSKAGDFMNFPILKEITNSDSIATEANSSLGILHNFSDFTDTSITASENLLRSKRKMKKPKMFSRQKNVSLEEEPRSQSNLSPEQERESSPDILYDGTNIPELNFECDTDFLIGERTGNVKESNLSLSSGKVPDFLRSLNIENKTFADARDSIFSSFEPSYQELFREHTVGAESVLDASSFTDFKSSAVDSILQKDQLEEKNFLQSLQKLSASLMTPIRFCPEEICARSSSLRSPSNRLAGFSQSVDSLFQTAGEDLKDDIITGSSLTKYKMYDSVQENVSAISNYGSGTIEPSEEMSAQSLSKKVVSFCEGVGNDPLFPPPGKDVKDDQMIAGSCCTKSDTGSSLYNKECDSSSYCSTAVGLNGSPTLPTSVPEGDLLWNEREAELDSKLGAANFSSASNLLSSSQFGLSESEFMKSDEVSDVLKEDEEAFKQEQMFEISSVSKSSVSSHLEASTTSWTLEVQNPHSPEEGNNREVSIGVLLGARSENVGTLSEDSQRERPYFGTAVSTPTKHFPDVKNTSDSREKSIESTMSSVSGVSSTESISFDSPHGGGSMSKIFDDASHIRPSVLASRIFEKFRPLHNSSAKISSVERSQHENNEETTDSTYLSNATPSSNETLTEMQESDSLATASMNTTLTERANPLWNITQSDAASDGGKTNAKTSCLNCQFQSAASSTRPPSSCSSCSSIPIPNHPAAVSAQNFLTASNNCFHSGMLYNPAYGPVQPPVMTFISPLHAGLPPYNPYHLQGANSFNVVQGPEELQYPNRLCIGVTKCLKLPVRNLWNAPCFYEVSCRAATLGDLPIPIGILGVNFPSSLVKSNSSGVSEIEITLSPCFEGKVKLDLQVAACSNEYVVPLHTTVKFEALRPVINISCKGKNCFNIGPIIAGSSVIEYITVEDASDITVPIHLTLSNDMGDNRVSFCERQMNHLRGVQKVSQKQLFYELPRSGSQASRLDIPIVFEAGRHDMDVSFTLTASMEEQAKEVLASLIISASVRFTRLVLSDPSQNPLRFHIREGISLKKSLTVKNQGPLHVTYDLHIEEEEDPNSFSVFPSTLSLQPMETSVVFITFSSSVIREARYSLQAAAQPHGQVFKVADIIGSVQTNPRHSLARPDRRQSHYECKNILEVNKKYLAWGGVDTGISVMKNFTLRNTQNRSLQLKLFIKEASQSFQLLNQNNETSQSLILDLEPKEEKPVSVVFSPRTTIICSGILGMTPTNENVKTTYSIPLSGYGGLGKLKVLGIPEREGIGYCLDMPVVNGKPTFFNVTLQNTGVRAVFVKIVLSSGGADNFTERISIHPSEFVLLENENKSVLISCTFFENFLGWNRANLGLMTLIYGDEIMRQQLRRNDLTRRQPEVLGIDHYPGVKFTSHFEGEEKVSCDSTYQSTPKDSSLFVSNLKQTLIHLNPVNTDQSYSHINFEALSIIENGFASVLGQSASTFSRSAFRETHSPPEKESATNKEPCEHPPTEKLKFQELPQPVCEESKKDNWAVKPEELCLDSSSRDSRIALINLSRQDLKFRIEYPVEVISISPLSGILPAKGEIGLRCRMIPNNSDKIPVSNEQSLRIICGNSEKSVLVKIAQDLRRQSSRLSLSTARGKASQMRRTASDTVLSNAATPVKNISDFPKEVTLPTTEPGDTSETPLVFQNTAKSVVNWKIKSTTFLFSQSIENICSEEILRIHPSSGVLNPMERCTINICFSPTVLDSYCQFFEFCLESEDGETKEKCNFKITGKGSLNASAVEARKSMSSSSNSSVKGAKLKKPKPGVYLDSDVCKFQSVTAGQSTQAYLTLKNFSNVDVPVAIIKPKSPFFMSVSSVIVKTKKFLKIPISFKPSCLGKYYEDKVIFQPENHEELVVKVKGFCF